MTIRPLTRLPLVLEATQMLATDLTRPAAPTAVCRTKPRPAVATRRRARPRTHACRRRVWAALVALVAAVALAAAWAAPRRLVADTAMYVLHIGEK